MPAKRVGTTVPACAHCRNCLPQRGRAVGLTTSTSGYGRRAIMAAGTTTFRTCMLSGRAVLHATTSARIRLRCITSAAALTRLAVTRRRHHQIRRLHRHHHRRRLHHLRPRRLHPHLHHHRLRLLRRLNRHQYRLRRLHRHHHHHHPLRRLHRRRPHHHHLRHLQARLR